jgi:branched-chain amino acid transport system substrate-binding protein
MKSSLTRLTGVVAAVALLGMTSGTALAKDKIVIAVPTFLTGGGAPAFGIPARNGTELIVQAINKGQVPAPYNTKGIAGAQVEPIIYDESGGGAKQVTEYRNKVQKLGVDLFAGFVSSGTCAAITPVAEELKTLTLYSTCGTPRVFEELDKNPKYVFRTMSHATADNVALAHYVTDKFGSANGYTGINQNYAWGQDSWRDFDLAMKVLSPDIKASDKAQWPKIFAGRYGTEISALLKSKEKLVHTSFWGGDLEAFIFQGLARGLFKKKQFLMTVAGTAAYRLGKKLPDGIVLGSRGPYGIYANQLVDTPLANWFKNAYVNRYGTQPTQPSYQYAQAILAAKFAYEKAAAANGGKWPSTDQVIAALEGATFQGVATEVRMARNNGHQGVTDHAWGVAYFDKESGLPKVKDVVHYKGDCVMPPDGTDSVSWIKGGMKGAKCD